jgi:hypothetical protein
MAKCHFKNILQQRLERERERERERGGGIYLKICLKKLLRGERKKGIQKDNRD